MQSLTRKSERQQCSLNKFLQKTISKVGSQHLAEKRKSIKAKRKTSKILPKKIEKDVLKPWWINMAEKFNNKCDDKKL